jgi:DNA-binding response OmpR family regulator
MVRSARILVVEDEPAIRNLIVMALTNEGYAVRQAWSGTGAVQQAASERPDLVVLDIMLPGLDGFAVAEELRRHYGPELPIIAMSAASRLLEQAREMGANGYLSKPFDLDELVETVESNLQANHGGNAPRFV